MRLAAPFRLLLLTPVLCLVACGISNQTPAATHTAGIGGSVHGGQQPVAGATIQLYTVGTTGDDSAATPLLLTAVTTDAGGNFNITGEYTCLNATNVYLVATGGNPGLSQANPNIALMAALGPCSSLTPSTFVTIDELTTVAAVYSLAPYMARLQRRPVPARRDASPLTAAFTQATQFVNNANGTTPGTNVPPATPSPPPLIDTLGDILATCINSAGGTAGDGSPCGQLFTLTTPSGAVAAPTDTIAAILNLAKNPTLNTTSIFNLTPAAGAIPTHAQLWSPPDLRVRLTPPAGQMVLQLSASSLTFPLDRHHHVRPHPGRHRHQQFRRHRHPRRVQHHRHSRHRLHPDQQLRSLARRRRSLHRNPHLYPHRDRLPRRLSRHPLQHPRLSPVCRPRRKRLRRHPHSHVLHRVHQFPRNRHHQRPYRYQQRHGCTCPLFSRCCYALLPVHQQLSRRPCSRRILHGFDHRRSPCTGALSNPQSGVDALSIVSNDPANNPGVSLTSYSFSTINVAPFNLRFPDTLVGKSSTLQVTTTQVSTIPVPNPTCPALSVSGSTLKLGSSAYTTTNNGNNNFQITCLFPVTFTPTAAGAQTGEVIYMADGSYLPVAATGITAAPTAVTVTPAALTVKDGVPGSVTVTNYTSAAVNIQSITPSSGFSQTNNCNGSLPAQSVCTVTITAPTSLPGTRQGGLTVVDDAGTQTTQLISQTDVIIDFQNDAVGVTSPIKYNLTAYDPSVNESGTVTLTATGDFNGSSCFFQQRNTQSCSASPTFTPTALGIRTGTLQATTTSADYSTLSQNFILKGTGQPAGPVLLLAPFPSPQRDQCRQQFRSNPGKYRNHQPATRCVYGLRPRRV